MHHDPRVRAGLRPARTRRRALSISAVDLRKIVSGGVVAVVLRITRGYSPEYLLKEVATGRENYYTGAVAEGEPPGRWWGAGAEKLGLRGLVDAQDMRAVYERFLDPRARGVHATRRGGTRCPPSDTPAAGTCPRTSCTPRRLNASRTPRLNAGPSCGRRRARRRGTTWRSSTSRSACRSRSRCCTPRSRPRRSPPARRATRRPRQAWAALRQAVEDAIWAGNNAGLAYLAEHAGYSRVGHHGGAAGPLGRRPRLGRRVVLPARLPRPRPAAAHPQRVSTGSQGPDGVWRTLDGRSLFRWRPAAARGRRADHRGAAHPRARGAGRDPPGRQGPRGRRRRAGGDGPVLARGGGSHREGRGAGRRVRGPVRPGAEQAGARPARRSRPRFATRAAKSHDGRDPRAAARPGRRGSCAPRSPAAWPASRTPCSPPAATGRPPQTWSPRAVIETALADVQQRKAGWTRADLTRGDQRRAARLPRPPRRRRRRPAARRAHRRGPRATPVRWTRARPGRRAAARRAAAGQRRVGLPGARGRSCTPPRSTCAPSASCVAATAAGGAAALPHAGRGSGSSTGCAPTGIELGADQAAAVRGVLTSGARVESLVGPAGTGKSFVVGALARAWTDPALRGDRRRRRVFGLATSRSPPTSSPPKA